MLKPIAALGLLVLLGLFVRYYLLEPGAPDLRERAGPEETGTRFRARAGRLERKRRAGTWVHTEKAVPPPAPASELEPTTTSQGTLAVLDPSEVGASLVPLPLVREPAFEADLETLRALTVDLWDNPDFLELDEARARVLFPLDDSVPSFPRSIASLVGGLPTEQDLEQAMRSFDVVEALSELAGTRSLLLELDMLAGPPDGSGKPRASSTAFLEFRSRLASLADSQTIELCRRLDVDTAYRDWRLLHGLYTLWERSP